MPFAEEIIRNNVKFKYLLSDKTKSNYSSSFDEDIWKKNKDALWRERKNKIRTDKENVCRRNKKGYKKI